MIVLTYVRDQAEISAAVNERGFNVERELNDRIKNIMQYIKSEESVDQHSESTLRFAHVAISMCKMPE